MSELVLTKWKVKLTDYDSDGYYQGEYRIYEVVARTREEAIEKTKERIPFTKSRRLDSQRVDIIGFEDVIVGYDKNETT